MGDGAQRWASLGLLAAVSIGMVLGDPARSATVHPNSQEACGLPAIDGDAAWKAERASAGLPVWTGALPARTDGDSGSGVASSEDGLLLLLYSDEVAALFDAPKRGGSTVGLYKRTLGVDLVRPSRDARSGWELCEGDLRTDPESCRPTGTVHRSRDYPGTWRVEPSAAGPLLVMEWKVQDRFGVTTRHRLRDGALESQIRVVASDDDAERGTGVVWVRFPVLDGIARPTGDHPALVLPQFNLGMICDDCSGGKARYPTMFAPMPWFGVLSGDSALYVGAHDPDGQVKQMAANGPTGRDESYFELYPESSGTPGNAVDRDWWTVLKPLCADRGWPVLTHTYREWVLRETEWGRAPPLEQRPGLDRDFFDGVWWFSQSIEPKAPAKLLLEQTLVGRKGLPEHTAHLWYSWYLPGMDRGSPVYEAKPGVGGMVRRVQSEGAYVFPYLSASHTDQSTAPGAPGRCDRRYSVYPKFWNDTLIRPSGHPEFEIPSSGACLVRMDTTAPEWTVKLGSVVDEALGELDSRGFYLDVLGNAFRGSWRSDRHPPGMGTWQTRADRELVRSLRRPGRIVAVEGALEQMIGIADIGVHFAQTRRDMAPLFPAVYHGRGVLAGMYSLPPDDGTALAIKNGLAVAWGLQPGLNSLQWSKPGHAKQMEWAKTLITARRRLADWLAYGEMIGPLAVGKSCAATQVTSQSWCDISGQCRPVRFTRPAVEAVLYRAGSGADAVVLVNLSEEAASHCARLPGYLAVRKPRIRNYDGRDIDAASVRLEGGELVLRVPGRSVSYVGFDEP